MKNNIKIIFVIIGAVIGAGFASGQEIYLFFYSYGIKGLWRYFNIDDIFRNYNLQNIKNNKRKKHKKLSRIFRKSF